MTTTPIFGQAIADMQAAIVPMLANVVVIVYGAELQGMFALPAANNSLGGSGITAQQPTLTLVTAEIPQNPRGETVEINGISYTVASVGPDEYGLSTLLLELA